MHDHQCVDGSVPSPLPWVIVPSKTPFGAWIMDASGGCVAAGFGNADAQILLHARENHDACVRYQKTLADLLHFNQRTYRRHPIMEAEASLLRAWRRYRTWERARHAHGL